MATKPESLGTYALVPNTDGSETVETPSTAITSDPRNLGPGALSVAEISTDGLEASRLSVSSDDSEELQNPPTESKHLLTFTNGLALVIGLQIGSGIFTAPSQVSQHVSSPGMGVLVWLLGGLLVWTGAASFIELGIAIPKNGGLQEYLRYCYGDFLAFLFTWVWVAIAKPSAMAMVAMVFSDHFCRSILPTTWLSLSLSKLIALLGLALMTYINCLGARTGALVANGFLVLKLFAVFSVAFLGLALAMRGGYEGPSLGSGGWFGEDATLGARSTWMILGDYVTATYGGLFCYGGWETIGFVAGDMKDAVRDLPRVINTAMVIVIIGFVLMNAALYIAIPIQHMRETSTPVMDFGITLFGTTGGILYSMIASASAMGSLNANIFATSRLCVAASKRLYFPRILANMHLQPGEDESEYYQRRFSRIPAPLTATIVKFAGATARLRLDEEVPIYAMLLSASLASLYILIGTFNGLVTFYGISEYLFFFLAVLGLYRVRRAKTLPSTYRTWTANPAIFCLVSGVLVLRGIVTAPAQGLVIVMLLLAGGLLFRRRFPRNRGG